MSGRLALRTVRPLLRQTGPFALSRPFARYESNVRIQNVRIRQRVFGWKRVGTWMLYSTGTFVMLDYWTSPPAGEEAEEESQGMDGPEEEWNEEDDLFLPLTWAKPRPRTYYKGSDPEWHEYVKFSKDPERIKQLRGEVVALIRGHLAKDKAFCARVGPVDVNTGASWLDIIFPDGPPQEYERTGIIVTGDSILWGSKPVTQLNQRRLELALYPRATWSALYATSAFVGNYYWARLKQMFITKEQNVQDMNALVETLRELREQSQRPGTAPPLPSSESKGASPDTPPSNANSSTNGKELKPPREFTANTNVEQAAPNPVTHLFKTTFKRNYKAKGMDPPRGSILVTGMTEVISTKTKCTMDVMACYDPKTNKIIHLKADLKRIQARNQKPRGGP